jgi:hypothetical protein
MVGDGSRGSEDGNGGDSYSEKFAGHQVTSQATYPARNSGFDQR